MFSTLLKGYVRRPMLLHESFKTVICISLPNPDFQEVIRTLDICFSLVITTMLGDDVSPSTSNVLTELERLYRHSNNRATSRFFQVVEACRIVIIKYWVIMGQSGNNFPFYAPMFFGVGSIGYEWGRDHRYRLYLPNDIC